MQRLSLSDARSRPANKARASITGYRDLGRHEDALAMNERVLEFMRRVLPANHPDIGEGCAGRDALHAL